MKKMGSKPKVSTLCNRDYTARENEKKIIRILEENKSGYGPKKLAFILGINEDTAKSMLKRLLNKGVVEKNPYTHGIYRLVDKYRHGSIFEWKFHNGVLTTLIKGYTGDRINKEFSSGLSKYYFEVGKESQKASLKIACSENPIEISSIYSLYLNFALLVEKYTGYFPPIKEVTISSIEFNKDFINLKIDGANCITLDS
ncbi:MAG: hypothetical protein NTZ83_05670, partial [Candidatus Pacearchaeota archaeon]|nr:hypothetical protein [Candidatus Pacearchaeota archaeon]